jgi:mannosyl-oligosaccharide glucosidase
LQRCTACNFLYHCFRRVSFSQKLHADSIAFLAGFRHTCEQHQLDGYGWTFYDPRIGGSQTFHDPTNGLDMTTSFVKLQANSKGQSWATRIKGSVRPDAPKDLKTTLIFHAGLEGMGHIQVDNEGSPQPGFEGDIKLSGATTDLGTWKMEVRESESSKHPVVTHEAAEEKDISRTMVRSVMVRRDVVWQALGM